MKKYLDLFIALFVSLAFVCIIIGSASAGVPDMSDPAWVQKYEAQRAAEQPAIDAHNARVKADPCFGAQEVVKALLSTQAQLIATPYKDSLLLNQIAQYEYRIQQSLKAQAQVGCK